MKSLLIAFMMFGICLNASAKGDDEVRRHFCRPDSTNISCQLEIALVCGPGYIDGCFTGETTTHRCVLANEGARCDEDVIILCPIYFRDGCETGETTRHQCVPFAGPSCKSPEAFECPADGFTDDCEL